MKLSTAASDEMPTLRTDLIICQMVLGLNNPRHVVEIVNLAISQVPVIDLGRRRIAV
jgi:hypothetical protein